MAARRRSAVDEPFRFSDIHASESEGDASDESVNDSDEGQVDEVGLSSDDNFIESDSDDGGDRQDGRR